MSTIEKVKIEDAEIQRKIKPWVDKYLKATLDGSRYGIFKKANAEKYVKWHYDIMGLPMPKVLVAENMFEMYTIAKKFENVTQFTETMETKTKPVLQTKFEKGLFVQTGIKENKTFFLDTQNIMHPILSTNLYEVMRTQLNELSKDFPKLITTAGWNIGIFLPWVLCAIKDFNLKGYPNDETFAFNDIFVNSGVYAMVFSKDQCVVCRYPKKVWMNDQTRLHNTFGPAVEWGNTKGFEPFDCYYINGRPMQRRIFDLIEKKELTKEMFITETDEEARAGMYEIMEGYGEGRMMEFLGASVVDEQTVVHKNGDTETISLYKTKECFPGETDLNNKSNVPLAWFKCVCPSTGQNYFIPSDSSFKTALEAAKYHRDPNVPLDMDYNFHFRG
jgi:hypothetical protein